MQQDYIPELGDDFVAISSGVCGISPFTAKLILYNELDDGYGRYFRDILAPKTESNHTWYRSLALLIPVD